MGKKIMVIDDDQGIRSFLEKELSAVGYQVETAERGAIGLQKLLTEDYALALIDSNMPEISGPAVCAALRKHEKTRKLPVVMMTATFHTSEQIAQAKADYGVDEVFLKPFKAHELCELLDRYLQDKESATKSVDDKIRPLTADSVPRLLHELYTKKMTGLLNLQRGEAKKIIYIKDGYPVFARSNVLSECLGRMLVQESVITQVDCDASVERCQQSGLLQGTVLIEMGLLTSQDLHQALARQVTEKLLTTFAWQEGTSQFFVGKDFKKSIARIKLSPANLILQGIKRFWSPAHLDVFLNLQQKMYLKQSADPVYRFQDIELGKRGTAILDQCRGITTTEQILEQHPLARREVQQVIASLLISELIEASTTSDQVSGEDIPDIQPDQPIDEKLRRKILDDYKRVMQSDYFDALGVSRQCGSSEVRRAYYKMAKEYHPDRFLGSGLSREMSNKVNELFQYVTQAYSVLSDSNTCATYLDELINGPKKSININQVIEAETAYQEGRAFLKMRNFATAAKSLKRSIELSPEEPEYLTHYAWALFKGAPEKNEIQNQALEILLASRELNPGLDLTHLYLGHIYQVQGMERQSEKAFEMAVHANPDCTEALRELRLLNLRREQQSTQSKGLFKKFRHKDD